jgi:hypothetical protein
MKPWVKLVLEVLTPGRPAFRAHMARLNEQERRLLTCLQILENPSIREVKSATDDAATF